MARRKVLRCPPEDNKVIFKDELSARIALADGRRDNNDREDIPRRAYRCKFGSHYHLTSKPARDKDEQGKASASRKSAENASRISRVASASWKQEGIGTQQSPGE